MLKTDSLNNDLASYYFLLLIASFLLLPYQPQTLLTVSGL